ncbi:MAG: hypothetical protein SGJ18_03905 [Pseudomonadota bacterium]|nr:hypothetical protein [Pseudomonadota bacterium]
MIRIKKISCVILGLLVSSTAVGQNKLFEARLGFQYAPQSYELDGGGFTTESGLSTGNGFSASLYWTKPEASYHFEFMSLNYNHDAPVGVTPSSVNSGFQRYLIAKEPTHQTSHGGYQGDSKLRFNYGLDIRQRTADRTAPTVYIPESYTAGARIGVNRGIPYNSQSRFSVGGGVFIPLYHDEQTSKTGHYRFSLNPDFHFTAVHKISPSFDISTGVEILLQRISYSATGERGTSNGVETFLNLQIPIELRFQF